MARFTRTWASTSEAMRGVAREMKVPLIELQNESIAYLDKVGEAAGNKLAITKKDNDGKTIFDKTHLNWAGSYVFGRMVAVDLGKAVPELREVCAAAGGGACRRKV